MKLLTSTTHFLLAVAVSVIVVSGAVAQGPPTPKPYPAPTVTSKEKEKEKEKEKMPKFPVTINVPVGIEWGTGTTTERSIAVDAKVNLKMCVTQGTVKVNGWNRNEVRAFVSEGGKFAFRVLQKSMKEDGKPVLLSLVGIKSLPGGNTTTVECINGDEIQLDVPENASLILSGRDSEISVDTLRKVNVDNLGGDITVGNVSEGVRIQTLQGNVVVERSQGNMVLTSQSGNIVAFDVQPSDAGDEFKAKTTGGSISIQKMQHRVSDVTSISGSVVYEGTLPSGGAYNFNTTNGSIRLMIPTDSSCRVTAIYGFGSFNSEIPMKDTRQLSSSGPVKTIVGTIGAGDCSLKLTTNSGSVVLKKLQ
jgi:hypothetical protein